MQAKKQAFARGSPNSDYRVRLSCVLMGMEQLFCRQFVTRALLMLFGIG